MKKILLFLFASVLSTSLYAQIKFEKGYFVDNSNHKTECLIKNLDWNKNPIDFEYKLGEGGIIQKKTISEVKEFGVGVNYKYVKANVQIDISSDFAGNLSSKSEPEFKKDEIFLQSLIEGKANLYVYKVGNLIRYFFNVDNSPIEQLIYKEYKLENDIVRTNNEFRQQLLTKVYCSSISIEETRNLSYRKKEFIDYFKEYNSCQGGEIINFSNTRANRNKFNLNLRPGINIASLTTNNSLNQYNKWDFGTQVSARFGVEAEIFLPLNNNKWALIIEPTYQYYNSDFRENNINNVEDYYNVRINVDYKSIEIPVGVRYYSFLNKNMSLFYNGVLVYDISLDSSFEYASGKKLEISPLFNVALGAGLKHKENLSLELRYSFKRDLLTDYQSYNSNYSYLGVVFGYTVL